MLMMAMTMSMEIRMLDGPNCENVLQILDMTIPQPRFSTSPDQFLLQDALESDRPEAPIWVLMATSFFCFKYCSRQWSSTFFENFGSPFGAPARLKMKGFLTRGPFPGSGFLKIKGGGLLRGWGVTSDSGVYPDQACNRFLQHRSMTDLCSIRPAMFGWAGAGDEGLPRTQRGGCCEPTQQLSAHTEGR